MIYDIIAMPRPPRRLFPNAVYHVLNRGVEQRPIVFDDRDRKTFLQLLGNGVQEYGLRLFAYCLMDNHYHLFLQTPAANLHEAMQSFQSQYARFINLRYARVGPLFQGRYKNRLVDTDAYSLTLARYLHRNPVEAGMVSSIEQYPWSSYRCYVGLYPVWPWLDDQWLLRQFHEAPTTARELFKIFHRTPSPPVEQRLLDHWRGPLGRPRNLVPLTSKGV